MEFTMKHWINCSTWAMLGIEMHMNSFKGANSGHTGLTKWYLKPVCPYIQKNFLELVTESYTVQSSMDKKKSD